MVFESGHVRVTLHGNAGRLVDTSQVSCLGGETGDEIRFDLAQATSVTYTDSSSVPEGYEPLADFVSESLSMAWEDGTHLSLLTERQSAV